MKKVLRDTLVVAAGVTIGMIALQLIPLLIMLALS